MPTATPDDVTGVIATTLDDQEITQSLTYAQELNEEYNTPANQTTTQTKNIERWAAIVDILQFKDPAVSDEQVGDVSATYEGSQLQRAKAQLLNWIRRAGGDTAMASTAIRDTSRHVTSTDYSD